METWQSDKLVKSDKEGEDRIEVKSGYRSEEGRRERGSGKSEEMGKSR